MDVVKHDSADRLLERTTAWLHAAEAENNLVLGICGRDTQNSTLTVPARQLLSVEHRGRVCGVAILTHQRELVITRMPGVGVDCLTKYLWARQERISSAAGPATTAKQLATRWSDRTGERGSLHMDQRIYACTKVHELPAACGQLRPCTADDKTLLCEWTRDFHVAVKDNSPLDRAQQIVESMLAGNRIFVWDDDAPVSCAAFSRTTRHGVAVNYVYTPPERRGSGYATTCVAAVTKRLLAGGRTFCCLYTDLSNGTPNRIYQRIGYEPVCDAQVWKFE